MKEFFASWILLQLLFLGENVGGKGVRWLAGYFMGYYTIWLALVKTIFVSFWELPACCLENVSGQTIGIYGEAIGGSTQRRPLVVAGEACPKTPSDAPRSTIRLRSSSHRSKGASGQAGNLGKRERRVGISW